MGMDSKKFGKILKNYRKKAGLTQLELAEILFVSASAVAKWEQGSNLPKLESIPAIAEALNVDELSLLSCLFSDSQNQNVDEPENRKDTWLSDNMSQLSKYSENFMDRYSEGDSIYVYVARHILRNIDSKCHYGIDTNTLDVWGRPLKYTITKIQDSGDLNKDHIYLEAKTKSGFIYSYVLSKLRVILGYYFLKKADPA